MDPIWQAAFTTIDFRNESDRRELPKNDLRYIITILFKSLKFVCADGEIWTNKTIDFFKKNKIVSANALTRKCETAVAVRSRH
jgi:hypothetical protein